jgi:hypothetical protein
MFTPLATNFDAPTDTERRSCLHPLQNVRNDFVTFTPHVVLQLLTLSSLSGVKD